MILFPGKDEWGMLEDYLYRYLVSMDTTTNFDLLMGFIDAHAVNTKDATITHTRISGGKYIIPEGEMNVFYSLMGGKFHPIDIVERHQAVGSIYIDLDYKQPFEMIERQYDLEHIRALIAVYHEIIRKYISVRDEDLVAMVAFRDTPVVDFKRNRVSDGLHIYYPFIVTEPRVQKMIRDEALVKLVPILDQLKLDNIYTDVAGKAKYYDVIDKSVIYANGVLMYGCTKLDQPIGENGSKIDIPPYRVQYVFGAGMEELDVDHIHTTEYAISVNCSNITEVLSIRRHADVDCQALTAEGQERVKGYQNDADRSAPKILNKQTLKLVNGAPTKSNYVLSDVVELVGMLAKHRWDGYEDWTRLGWAIHNIDPRSEPLFELFKTGSMESPKYTSGCCERHWAMAAKTGNIGGAGGLLGIGSLHNWAKLDNPARYNAWKLTKLRPCMEESASGTHWSIATVLYKMFNGNHRCVMSKKTTVWFTFEPAKHRWEADDSGSDLRIKIPTLLAEEYAKLIEEYNKLASDMTSGISDEARLEYANKADVFHGLIRSLETRTFADNVMRWAQDLFNEKNFVDQLDEVNKDLIGFSNGVYDLEKGVFRDGDPSDYISMSTGNEYIPYSEIGDDDPRVLEIHSLLASIFPDESVLNYNWLVLASCLDGHVLEQKFRLWMGKGSNGKGILRKLVDLGFGDYCHTLKATVLTRKQGDAENANSSIAQTKGCRIVFFDEPDEGDKIHVGTMKHYSGGDPIQARMIYGIPFEFYPQFSMFLLTNVFPELPPNDDGTWRRMEPTYFPNRFVEDEPTEANEFKMDKELPKRLPGLAPVFMSMLVEKYKEYRKHGITVPAAIRDFKRQYQRNCDIMLDFLDDTLCSIENRECKINIDDLYADYRLWFRNNGHEKVRDIASKQFKEYINKQFKGKIVGADIVGVKYTSNGGNRRAVSGNASLSGYSVGGGGKAIVA